jgi:hypothetical protein
MSTSFKCTESAKTAIPQDLADKLAAKARMAGCNSAEYLRDLICMDVHGCTFGELVAHHRRAVIGVQGYAQDHKGTPT